MVKRKQKCIICKKVKEHYAKEKCVNCYKRLRYRSLSKAEKKRTYEVSQKWRAKNKERWNFSMKKLMQRRKLLKLKENGRRNRVR